MKKNIEQQLTELGPARLAKALIELSERSDIVQDFIERLISTPEEKIENFKNRLAEIKTSKRYISWDEASDYAEELEMLLMDLKDGVDDPLTGMNLLTDFYKADEYIFERCDDSDGDIPHVFCSSATDIFIEYAEEYSDKKKIADILINLNKTDDYALRDSLIDCSIEFLPEKELRYMISEFHKLADDEDNESEKSSHYINIEYLARQLKDPKLFEKTKAEARQELSTIDYIEISEVYLESGDTETAHLWLKNIPEDDGYASYKRENLLKKIYQKQGNSEKLAELLHQQLRSNYSMDNLQALLDVIGQGHKDKIIGDELTIIMKKKELSFSDAKCLISAGKIDEAEKYIIERADKLDGYLYESMLPIAELMDSNNRHLAAALLYRRLLISILNRGYTKAYHHGVSYLKKLDQLAINISDWKNFDNHEAFKDEIIKEHGRKRSFWSKYKD